MCLEAVVAPFVLRLRYQNRVQCHPYRVRPMGRRPDDPSKILERPLSVAIPCSDSKARISK